jgi:hypothetical protein
MSSNKCLPHGLLTKCCPVLAARALEEKCLPHGRWKRGTFAALAIVLAFAMAGLLARRAQAQTGSWSCSLADPLWSQGSNTFADFACTNGTQTQNFQIAVPPIAASTWFSDEAAALIAQLSVPPPVAPPVGQTITPTAQAAPDPNAAIKAQFNADYGLLRQYEQAIADGITTTTDLNYTAQLAKVQTEFLANETVLITQVPQK